MRTRLINVRIISICSKYMNMEVVPLNGMNGWIITAIILGVMIIITVVLYFVGKKLEKKQNEQKTMMEANKQTVSMLVIDKKKLKMKDANLPASIMDQVPKLQRNIKVPMAKVKVGPQIITMFCDEGIYDELPLKKEIKAEVSGIYIMNIKSVRGGKPAAKEEVKKGFFKRAVDKLQEKTGAKPIK